MVNRQRYIPIHSFEAEHSVKFCVNLIAAHILTGRDTTSTLHHIEKRVSYTKLLKHVRKNNLSLVTFGMQNEVEADVSFARSYVLSLYRKKAKASSSQDQLRYLLASTTDKPASQLPPTGDAFKQQFLRARYQTSIWCQSHVAYPSLGSPVGNGWYLSDSQLEPIIYIKESAAEGVRDLSHMYCSDSDSLQSNKRHCLLNHLCSTEFCACRGDCQNTEAIVDSDRDDDNLD